MRRATQDSLARRELLVCPELRAPEATQVSRVRKGQRDRRAHWVLRERLALRDLPVLLDHPAQVALWG